VLQHCVIERLGKSHRVEVSGRVELAPHCRQVPDFFEAYNRAAPPVDLPQFITALSTLVAEGILLA
jgi:hypothetical protein